MTKLIKRDECVALSGDTGDRVTLIRVATEHDRVEVVIRAIPLGSTEETELVQYLDPVQAMAFSKAFERFAVEALKNSA